MGRSQIIAFALFAGLIAFSAAAVTPVALADDASAYSIPPENAPSADFSAWASSIDSLGQLYMRKPKRGEYLTSVGTILGRSCFEGKLASRREQTIQNFEKLLEHAIAQAERCDRAFKGLPNVHTAISILRRARIHCKKLDKDVGASNDVVSRRGINFLFHYTNASYDRTYTINVPLPDENFKLEAEDLFHEALHSTASNNRDWHTKNPEGHPVNGCAASRFLDRIYMTEAVCFPSEGFGRDFYEGATRSDPAPYACPGLCENALTSVDPETRSYYEQAKSILSSEESIIGPPLAAITLSSREAGNFCERIRSAKATFDKTWKKPPPSIDQGTQKITSMLKIPFEDSNAVELLRQWTQSRELLLSGYDSTASFAEIRSELGKQREQLSAFIQDLCSRHPGPGDAWQPFCAIHGAPILSEVSRYIVLADQMLKESYDGGPSAEHVLDLFTEAH